MTYILALAHYCDTHGPTPLMVTEGLPISCTTCFDHDGSSSIPRSTPAVPANTSSTAANMSANVPSEALRNLNISATSRSNPSAQPALETPPVSPRPVPSQPRRDSSFRRTYDDTVTRKQGPCDNCAMTLPRRSTATSAADSSISNTNKGPTLRTRAPAERVFGSASGSSAASHVQSQFSPPNSQYSSDTDGEADRRSRNRTGGGIQSGSSRTTSCSSASTASEGGTFHVHYVDYTSTHEPVLPASFSLLRASCLRTLSFETLPRAPTVSASNVPPPPTPSTSIPSSITSPTSSTGSFVTTQSAGSAVSGGPIFFGDSLAGYTTAYIFRIPDVHARGHKRVYAFMALSTHKERLAMKTFAIISSAFRDLATWIQSLAETEAERAAESSPISGAFHAGAGAGAAGAQQQPTSGGGQTSAFDQPDTRNSGSSFLTGGSGFTRRMGGGGGASAPKARGLAELVGQPDFFIELHKRFVQLLFEVGVTLNS